MGITLSQGQVDFYRENGFCVAEGIFDAAVIEQARAVVDGLLSSADLASVAEAEPEDGSRARRIWAPTSRDKLFAGIAEDTRLLDAVEQLIGPDIVLQYSKLNVKPPRVGSVVEWHQDFAYYPHTNTDLVATLIYLDDATRENACLRVVPGSHRHGLFKHEADGHFVGKVASPADAGLDDATVTDCEGPAGSVVFIHPLLLHSSEKNLSDMYRRVFIPSYRAADALPIYYGPHAAHNEPTAKLVRGTTPRTVRSEPGQWQLPIAAAEFNSLYQVQEGSHLGNGTKTPTGYFAHETDTDTSTNAGTGASM
ncbi:phytanoyl-CoA dioxygenase family protein [Streptacidiphilus sp. PB12-B1b]|uniref:phytanoyl-CoA dioxygenase family protein n=1 Tax=Streptacidiphilus sp. PB12-B1b TaxID=2705012 RepID=UPI0015F8FFC8|nr:phytanoyl-CoA dioxygenase family protein [Streptacidiphilus sp. PB12-B1b]QMU75822.1 phytanoyl-CoA dioxygenase family protein [Streptacidiphilus sp. PB12-B1b]